MRKKHLFLAGACIVVFASLVLLVYNMFFGYVNKNDSINNSDEKLIKDFRSHHGYTYVELKNLDIKYLGSVDDYRIYFVPFRGSSGVLNDNDWIKNKYKFPLATHTRIIGIKNNKLFTLGNMIYETRIDIGKLYSVIPKDYK